MSTEFDESSALATARIKPLCIVRNTTRSQLSMTAPVLLAMLRSAFVASRIRWLKMVHFSAWPKDERFTRKAPLSSLDDDTARYLPLPCPRAVEQNAICQGNV